MRIDAYNQVAQVYGVNKTNSTTKTNAARPMAKDQVSISSAGRDFQVAKQAVSEASDIREDKVAEVKSRIDSGNYNVDTGDFASMLLEKYNAQL